MLTAKFTDSITGDEVSLEYEPRMPTYRDYAELDDAARGDASADRARQEMMLLELLVERVDGYDGLEAIPLHWVRPFAGVCYTRQVLGLPLGGIGVGSAPKD